MAKKLGLALGAGGSRGVAHIGFLRALEEENIKPDFISGTSMGAVVGACYSKGFSIDEMEDIVTKLKFSDIFDLSLNPISSGALLRSQKMRKKLAQFLGATTFGEMQIPFTCVATDIIEGKNVVLGKKEDEVCGAVVASSSIPSIFKPVQMDDKLLVDGGIMCRVPIQTVRDMGAEVVVAVDVLGKTRRCDKKFNMFSLLLRAFDIEDSELVKYKVKEQNPDVWIEVELGDMSQYKFKDIGFAIDCGYQTGKNYAKQVKELIEK